MPTVIFYGVIMAMDMPTHLFTLIDGGGYGCGWAASFGASRHTYKDESSWWYETGHGAGESMSAVCICEGFKCQR